MNSLTRFVTRLRNVFVILYKANGKYTIVLYVWTPLCIAEQSSVQKWHNMIYHLLAYVLIFYTFLTADTFFCRMLTVKLYSFVLMRITLTVTWWSFVVMESKFEFSVLKTCIVLLILTAGLVTSLIIKDITSSIKDGVSEDFGGWSWQSASG